MTHLVLLGDSVFDNGAYVPDGRALIDQLRRKLPANASATLLAVDGNVVADVGAQLARLPANATHLFISAGGNDALAWLDILSQPARSYAEVLNRMADIAASFEADYRHMLARLGPYDLPLTLCTIYYPHFPVPELQKLAVSALSHFNDVILRCAIGSGALVLDLRLICDEAGDYANAIEPSCRGGEKITDGVLAALALMQGAPRAERTVVLR